MKPDSRRISAARAMSASECGFCMLAADHEGREGRESLSVGGTPPIAPKGTSALLPPP